MAYERFDGQQLRHREKKNYDAPFIQLNVEKQMTLDLTRIYTAFGVLLLCVLGLVFSASFWTTTDDNSQVKHHMQNPIIQTDFQPVEQDLDHIAILVLYQRSLEENLEIHSKQPFLKSFKNVLVKEFTTPLDGQVKNSPLANGLDQLYSVYPNSDWYVVITNGTYLFPENLRNHLKKYNPRKEFVVGKKKEGKKFQFSAKQQLVASAGFAISHPIVRKMVYENLWSKCASESLDALVSSCLVNAGASMQFDDGFHNEDVEELEWPMNPCDGPITMSGIEERTIQSIYNSQQNRIHSDGSTSKYNEFMSYSHLFPRIAHLKNGVEMNIDRPCPKCVKEKAATGADCQAMCQKNDGCLSWTFDGKYCTLKDVIPPRKPSPGAISGVILNRYVCKK